MQHQKTNYQALMPYILCVCGPNIVVLGARCPQPSSSRSSPSTSYLWRHPSWCRSDTSQFFTLKPLFWVSLLNLLLEDTPKFHDRTKLWNCKRVHLYTPVGLKMDVLAHFLSTCPLVICSSSRLNSGPIALLYVITAASLTVLSTRNLSTFKFAASFFGVTPSLS